jgi:hypothetical protein
MGDDLDQDFSWVFEQERLHNPQNNFSREPMEQIQVKYIYVNQNKYIDKVLCETLELSSGNVIPNEQLIHMTESKKIKTPTSRYKLKEILLFNIDLDPEHIQAYAKNDNFITFSKPFMKVLSILDKIIITDSVFIFHDINTLYFIFEEVELEFVGGGNKPSTIKSILKKDNSGGGSTTKKVRITVGNNTNSKNVNNKAKKTRRNRLTIEA